MCGIAGIVATHCGAEEREALVRRMIAPLHHRGPDAEGIWNSANAPIALAHRRLAIQDLSPNGQQPMVSASGRFYIVFNGEIYNFKELRNALETEGAAFKGGSDTEVMLAAFEHWGIEPAVKRFVGMFAFALFDQHTRTLHLCRDRMGEKPLYYGWVDGNLVFASELKAIQAMTRQPLPIEQRAITSYLRFGYIPTPYSIYQNIFKLPPATIFGIGVDQCLKPANYSPLAAVSSVSPQHYWNLHDVARAGAANQLTDDDEAINELDALLKNAIKDQCIADVPIGAFLSGGVDSTTVAAIMQSVNAKPINTFTIGFKEKQFDEAPYARAIAAHLGTTHEELYISADDCLSVVPEIPHWWDEPFADSSQIPALLVARMAKRHVTVCLSGDGGDELFCGYNRYISTEQIWSRLKSAPASVRNMAAAIIESVSSTNYDRGYALLKKLSGDTKTQANIGAKAHKLAEILRLDDPVAAYKFLLSYWQNPHAITGCGELDTILDLEPNPDLGPLSHNAMYWDQQGYLVDDNLVKGDRSSMAASLEARLPLLDHRIAEFSWRCPAPMRQRDNQSKWLLRQVLYRYVPKNLIERPKMGFSVPVAQWLRGPLSTWAADLIHSDALAACGLAAAPIQRAWHEHSSGSKDNAHKLWTVLMLLAWYSHARESLA